MSAVATHFKLGILTLVAAGSALAVVFALGIGSSRSKTVAYDTYFDESVQGLGIGSPVAYRGILVGSVEGIKVAPDTRLVDVTLGINRAEARTLKLDRLSPDLRTQLATQGITGLKFVEIDFFDPRMKPAPTLTFRPQPRYIPATESTLKHIEDNVESWADRVPAIIDALMATMAKVESILTEANDEHLPARIGATVDDIHAAAKDLRTFVQHVDRAHIPDKTAAALDALATTIANVNVAIERISGDGGLISSTQNAADNIGELGRNAAGSAADLDRTLRELSDAAQAIRDLALDLDRDPDMLVNGRAKRKGP